MAGSSFTPTSQGGSKKPRLSFWQIWNMSFGFLGIQFGFGLQNANVSRIFETLGADIEDIPILWIAAPVTGLLIQPIIGYFSDNTWGRLGRRRPYFLVGAILASIALIIMPNSPVLWVAAGMLWIMDASINVSMEPFRAFVGDLLPAEQRTTGFAMQSFFIGTGAVVASALPYILTNWLGIANTAPEGEIAPSVKFSFYAGGVVFLLAVLWTVIRTKEYSPEEMAAFEAEESGTTEGDTHEPLIPGAKLMRTGLIWLVIGLVATALVYYLNTIGAGKKELYVLGGGLVAFGLFLLIAAILTNQQKTENGFIEVINDLLRMPKTMSQLAVVQFFSWFALFSLWIYATNSVSRHYYDMNAPVAVVESLSSYVPNLEVSAKKGELDKLTASERSEKQKELQQKTAEKREDIQNELTEILAKGKAKNAAEVYVPTKVFKSMLEDVIMEEKDLVKLLLASLPAQAPSDKAQAEAYRKAKEELEKLRADYEKEDFRERVSYKNTLSYFESSGIQPQGIDVKDYAAISNLKSIQQSFNDGGDWIGICFAVYNGIAALFAFLIPALARRITRKRAHAISLVCGGLGLISVFIFKDPYLLLVSMVGIGIAWASILSMPYAILSGALPINKMGIYMGIFNFFIVIPQLIAASILGFMVDQFFGKDTLYALAIGGLSMILAAVLMRRVYDVDAEKAIV